MNSYETIPNPTQPTRPKKSSKHLIVPCTISFLIGSLIGCGAAGNDNQSVATSTPAATVTVTASPSEGISTPATPTAAQTATASTAPTTESTTAEAVEWHDGMYEVGTGKDIKPGKYRVKPGNDYGDAGMPCYWATLKDADGSLGSIIANATPAGPSYVSIPASANYFEVSGCVVTPA